MSSSTALSEQDARRLRALLADELRSAAICRALARLEDDPARAGMLEHIAQAELRHAEIIARRIGAGKNGLRPARLGPGGLVLSLFARLLGTSRVVGILSRRQGQMAREFASLGGALDSSREKREHARALQRLAANGQYDDDAATAAGGFLAGRGGTLRAAVLGINDGLVSNFSLVMGVAGGVDSPSVVVLAGVAGLLAGAFSMAAGEYISMRSQRDVHEYMIAQQKTELELWPEEERAELAAIYMAKGLTRGESETVAERLMKDPGVALETKVREDLGLDPDDLGSPWGAALSSMVAFTTGAFVPIAPYLFGADDLAFTLSAVLSGGALAAVGAGLAWLAGVSRVWGALRMLLVGGAAASVTYGIGYLIGVQVT